MNTIKLTHNDLQAMINEAVKRTLSAKGILSEGYKDPRVRGRSERKAPKWSPYKKGWELLSPMPPSQTRANHSIAKPACSTRLLPFYFFTTQPRTFGALFPAFAGCLPTYIIPYPFSIVIHFHTAIPNLPSLLFEHMFVYL